ncbi:PEP-CTERM sorting domain-containing protein [Verrucomicrobiaceae bacterium R5-34]|nr:PEP-CTERM sorting domain-containing protein [Verrucomicrobiaceae bacterium R5-34]
MKHTILTSTAAASILIGTAQAATVTWNNTSTDGLWYTDANWDTGSTPVVDGTDNVMINNGDTITHNPSVDLDITTGSTVTVSGGSTVNQTVTNWQRLQGGTLTIDNATWNTTSYFRVGFDNGDAGGTFNLINGASATFDNEFHVGPDVTRAWTNPGFTFDMNIGGGSTLDLNGAVGMWLYDSDLSDYNINFTGAGTIEGRIGIETEGVANNVATWENLWDNGILQWNGANVGQFDDYFSTSGTAGTTEYTLTAVPEPSSAALVGLSGLALILRRRK